MGILFSKKSDSNGFAKQLLEIEDKITEIEDRLLLSRDFQKRLLKRILIYAITLEIVILVYTYIKIKSLSYLSDKILNSIWALGFPIFIYFLTHTFNFFYNKYIKKNESKLDNLKQSLQKKLDDRKRDTDYEATQKLLDKYEKIIQKKNRNSSNNNKGSNTSNNTVTTAAATTATTTTAGSGRTSIGNPNKPTNPSPSKPTNPQQVHNNSNLNNNSPQLNGNSGNNGATITHRVNQQSPNKINNNTLNNGINAPVSPNRVNKQPLPPPQQSSWWLDKLVEYIISDGPKYGAPLICNFCHSHNGYIPSEELSSIQFRCRFCQEFNQKGTAGKNNTNSNSSSGSSNNSSKQEVIKNQQLEDDSIPLDTDSNYNSKVGKQTPITNEKEPIINK